MRYVIMMIWLLFIQQTYAQVTLGVRGGYTNAWEQYDFEVPDGFSRDVNGSNYALMTHVSISDVLEVGLEPGYIRRGTACVPGILPPFDGDTQFLMDYIDLPLTLRGSWPLFNNKLNIYGKAGYGLSYMVSATQVTISSLDDSELREKVELGNDSRLNRMDHGMNSSIGFAKDLDRSKIFIESSIYSAFTDADKWNFSQNQSVNVSFGYSWTF